MSTNRRLRIGIVAPPWLPVPPESYGGTELALDVLCRGLQQRGHDVELATIGSSTCDVPMRWLFESADPDRMGTTILELRHVAAAYEAFDQCDIVHDHTAAGLFISQLHPELPVVATNHGPFDDHLADLYGRVPPELAILAISHDQASRAPSAVTIGAVIHHGLDLDHYCFGSRSGDYLLALGRMNPDKGIDVAIEVARRAGLDLAIAAKMREPAERRYFHEVIRPLLGRGVEYVGEVNHADKVELLGGARALINPIRWPEPFGLVMIESLACGTPVIGTPCGAAPEIVEHGITGFLASTATELAEAVGHVDFIDRKICRSEAEHRFSMDRMAREHEAFYVSMLTGRQASCSLRASAGSASPDKIGV